MCKTVSSIRALSIDWHRLGRAILFSLALFTSPYPALGFGWPWDPGYLTAIAYFHPVLFVLWGFWKAHSTVGWSVIGIHGFNTVVFVSIALLRDSFQNPAGLFVWPEISWENIALFPFLVTGLHHLSNFWWWMTLCFCWRADRHLLSPAETPTANSPVSDQKPVPMSIHQQRQRHMLLLASAIVCAGLGGLLTAWLSGMFLALPKSGLPPAASEAHWLIWPVPGMDSPHAAFHMSSVTALGLMLVAGMALKRVEIVEAACWLLLPGQLLTVSLYALPLMAAVGTASMLILGLLVQWHFGFPMALLKSRRVRQAAIGTD